MSTKFLADGRRNAVTLIKVGPCVVIDVKTHQKAGYNAVQLGLSEKKKATKALLGHIKKAGLTKMPRFLREIRLLEAENLKPGQVLKVEEVFQTGDTVQVTGTSRGKGFTGVMKRWGFHGGPKTHGQSDRQRAPGSIGATTTPGRVLKGKKMAGRSGGETVTIKNLKVLEVDGSTNLLVLKGAIVGPKNGLLKIKRTSPLKRENVEAADQVQPETVVPEPTEEVKTEEVSTEVKEIKGENQEASDKPEKEAEE